MTLKTADLENLFEKALSQSDLTTLEEVGVVVKVGDGMCHINGITHALYGEIVLFEGGNKGMILDLEEDLATAFFLYNTIPVNEGEMVHRTKSVFKLGVGESLLGRVVNALGTPIDGLGTVDVVEERSIEVDIPGIADRSPVNESLETGIMAIDTLVPIGRGQRELIIGNRNTGKTAIALDTILHQKGKNVLCIYVAIGQRQVNVARLMHTLQERGSLEYTAIIIADASDAVLCRYMAPYVGTTLAEYLRDQGRDVLIVYDDLTDHAIAYREMSLLMRRSPGREAYPGDIFYLHSHLLERSGKFLAGGSITALPIVQLQGDDLTAYIPTNLISITDGQIFLDSHLFNSGVRPAVNGELSVSRVGGAAQTKAIRKVTKSLRLDLAQYSELVGFSQFGTELDIVSQRQLARGAIAVELLKQDQFNTRPFEQQAIVLFLFQKGFLEGKEKNLAVDCAWKLAVDCAWKFVDYIKHTQTAIYDRIKHDADISTQTDKQLSDYAREFMMMCK
ncbi:MAG: ATP synthase subunit alpha [candidate division TM6 bacterium GW2011_GWE2_41_16]|nr:MAG: ATP synthase subunit alpha [candidate division TM6 bacterium GW2011_GWE2_41_16]